MQVPPNQKAPPLGLIMSGMTQNAQNHGDLQNLHRILPPCMKIKNEWLVVRVLCPLHTWLVFVGGPTKTRLWHILEANWNQQWFATGLCLRNELLTLTIPNHITYVNGFDGLPNFWHISYTITKSLFPHGRANKNPTCDELASLSFPMQDDLQGKVQNKPTLIEWEAKRTQSTWHNCPGIRTRVGITTIQRVKHGNYGAHCGDRFFSRSSSSTFKLSTHFSPTSFMLQKSLPLRLRAIITTTKW